MNDQIEMFWKCSACSTINGGLSKRCGERVVKGGKVVLSSGEGCGNACAPSASARGSRRCVEWDSGNRFVLANSADSGSARAPGTCLGEPRTDLDHQNWFMPEDISKYANLTEAVHIAQAREGGDWMCAYCGSTQRNSKGECAVCGGDREFSHQKQINSSIPPTYREEPSAPFKKRKITLAAIGIGITVLVTSILISSILIWIFTPRYVEAQVQSTAWTGVIQVERYKRIRDEGWDTPGDAEEIRDEGRRVHHHDSVKVGSHQESYNESVACGQDCRSVSIPRVCTSNNNGTANCTGGGTRQECTTKYCNETRYRTVDDYEDVPRYRTWYSWHAWRWRHQRNVHSGGSDLRPYPPDKNQIRLNAGCTGREKEKQSLVKYTFRCTFRDEKSKVRTYDPSTESEYQQCTQGRSAKLKLVVGTVSVEKWR